MFHSPDYAKAELNYRIEQMKKSQPAKRRRPSRMRPVVDRRSAKRRPREAWAR